MDLKTRRRIAQTLLTAAKRLETAPDVLEVPDIRQFNNYTCGSASLLAVLSYWDLYDGLEDRLAKELGTDPDDGTDPEEIVRVARMLGLGCEMKTDCSMDDLRESLDRECPVIVNFQAWSDYDDSDWSSRWDDGHYAVLIGMDDENLYMRDPSLYNRIGSIEKSEFEDRWHDVSGKGVKYNRMAIFFEGPKSVESDKVEEIE